ncbi:MAG: DEAD/DEAH box helicase family protein [Calothrix sp. MO_167.B12]|nr:DEAD/DEAH box helicase family protein [Calothrix sp. MO_167.B12]
MVDFKKLRESKNQPTIIEPTDIFRRLPKPQGINDLYTSQDQVLKEWFNRRNESDLVIKLHTGGGKTLVGLLIALSILHEHHQPVIYLSPTLQLVEQTFIKAKEYSIPAVCYDKKTDFPEDFVAGKSVLICTYQSLFNGLSRFGVNGSRTPITAAAIILDDAHVAFSTMRDQFTLRVERKEDTSSYEHLTNIFRHAFKQIDKEGTFDDIVSGAERHIVLEVPYWSWKEKSDEVRQFLRHKKDSYKFVWSFIRDNFDYCHCLISKDAFIITPLFPLVNMIPTFADCPHRIFMSATISDDSAIVRTFDANSTSIAQPIKSKSLAGVSERMILAPELMQCPPDNISKILQEIAKEITEQKKVGTVILVPSNPAAQEWKNVATIPNSSDNVNTCVKELQEGKSYGPFVFANRYDGIDLPNSACRLLILSDLPKGSSEYEQYRANTLMGSLEFTSTLAQRIEQGVGRGARGSGDYCVVILTGKKLISWLGLSSNLKFLTQSTRAQFEMGVDISKSVTSKEELYDTIMRCLSHDKEWTQYHAETLAESTECIEEDKNSLNQAAVERKAFKLIRDGYFDKAISKLEKYCEDNEEKQDKLDKKSRGWLKQFAARAAHYWGETQKAQKLQKEAFANNNLLIRPIVTPPYKPITIPGQQTESLVDKITKYKPLRRAYLAWFEQAVSQLVPESSANQFEQGLKDLGSILGFQTERPENIYGEGPDVLWLFHNNHGLVIEAKSRKKEKNFLNKDNHGQLLVSVEWFKKNYPDYSYTPVSVHPNVNATKNAVADATKALTYDKLNELITNTRNLLTKLCDSALPDEQLIFECEKLLSDSRLTPESIIEHYLVQFQS